MASLSILIHSVMGNSFKQWQGAALLYSAAHITSEHEMEYGWANENESNQKQVVSRQYFQGNRNMASGGFYDFDSLIASGSCI